MKAGGTLRVGSLKPAIAVDPVTSATQATLALTSITGEFLVYVSPETGQLKPEIATAWKTPDGKGATWVFTLRPGVKFHDGTPLTADDVVATFQRLSDPKNNSSALSVLKGLLAPDGITKTGPLEVTMKPVAPSPSLPFLIGSPMYQGVILPKDYVIGSYEKTFPGTGPYKLASYVSGTQANFVKNPAYWGGAPALDGVNITLYADTASQIQALQGGTLDLIPQFGYQEGQGLIKSKQFTIFDTKSSVHRELAMRVDVPPFNDKDARIALALALNRPSIIKTLFGGEAVPGNDSPIAPSQAVYPKGVPQRKQDLRAGQEARCRQEDQHAAHDAERLRAARPRGARPERGEGDRLHDQAEAPERHGRTTPARGRRPFPASRAVRARRHALAERGVHGHGLGPEARPERDPHLGVQDRRRLERVALLEQGDGQADRPVHVDRRPRHAALARGEDPEDLPRGHAGDPAVLLQLPRGRQAEHQGLHANAVGLIRLQGVSLG